MTRCKQDRDRKLVLPTSRWKDDINPVPLSFQPETGVDQILKLVLSALRHLASVGGGTLREVRHYIMCHHGLNMSFNNLTSYIRCALHEAIELGLLRRRSCDGRYYIATFSTGRCKRKFTDRNMHKPIPSFKMSSCKILSCKAHTPKGSSLSKSRSHKVATSCKSRAHKGIMSCKSHANRRALLSGKAACYLDREGSSEWRQTSAQGIGKARSIMERYRSRRPARPFNSSVWPGKAAACRPSPHKPRVPPPPAQAYGSNCDSEEEDEDVSDDVNMTSDCEEMMDVCEEVTSGDEISKNLDQDQKETKKSSSKGEEDGKEHSSHAEESRPFSSGHKEHKSSSRTRKQNSSTSDKKKSKHKNSRVIENDEKQKSSPSGCVVM